MFLAVLSYHWWDSEGEEVENSAGSFKLGHCATHKDLGHFLMNSSTTFAWKTYVVSKWFCTSKDIYWSNWELARKSSYSKKGWIPGTFASRGLWLVLKVSTRNVALHKSICLPTHGVSRYLNSASVVYLMNWMFKVLFEVSPVFFQVLVSCRTSSQNDMSCTGGLLLSKALASLRPLWLMAWR